MAADGGEGNNGICSGVAGINFDTMHPMNIPNVIHATFVFNHDRRHHEDDDDDDDDNAALLDWHKMFPVVFDDTRRTRASS